jgi:hypothetical protein
MKSPEINHDCIAHLDSHLHSLRHEWECEEVRGVRNAEIKVDVGLLRGTEEEKDICVCVRLRV